VSIRRGRGPHKRKKKSKKHCVLANIAFSGFPRDGAQRRPDRDQQKEEGKARSVARIGQNPLLRRTQAQKDRRALTERIADGSRGTKNGHEAERLSTPSLTSGTCSRAQ